MNIALTAIRDRLDRADEHVQFVKELLRDYYNSDRCRYRGEYDPQANQSTVVQTVEFPDIRLATRVGELVHDLCSALNHLAWQLVLENKSRPGQHTRFPIKDRPLPKKKGVIPPPRVSGGVSKNARELIARWQPYNLGDDMRMVHADTLWILHRLSIVDKHCYIPVKGVLFGNISFGGPGPIPRFTWTAQRITATEHEARMALVPDDQTVGVQGSASVQVILHEPTDIEPSVTFVEEAAARVRMIVDEAERDCFT